MSDEPITRLHGLPFVEWKRELEQQTDRGAAIIGAAFLEARLEEAIRSRFVGAGEPIESLFRGDAALGTFRAKTDVGLALGLYASQIHRELNLIRRIRNKFAHHFGAISFTTPDIVSQCSELWLPRNILDYGEATAPTDPREQFVRAVLLIFHLLLSEMKRQPSRAEGAALSAMVRHRTFGTWPVCGESSYNFTFDRTAGSHSLAAAGQRARYTHKTHRGEP